MGARGWAIACAAVVALAILGTRCDGHAVPRLRPLPLPDVGVVQYPKSYERSVFRHADDMDSLLPKLASDLAETSEERTEEEILASLRESLHSLDQVPRVVEQIMDEADRAMAGHTNGTDFEVDRIGPKTMEEVLAEAENGLPQKVEALQQRLAMAMQVVNQQMNSALGYLDKQAQTAKSRAPKLYDEFVEATVRETEFWRKVVTSVNEKYQRKIKAFKAELRDFRERKRRRAIGHDIGKQMRRPSKDPLTIRYMYDLCYFDGTPITSQLGLLYPDADLMPVSAHPFCWCEGRLNQAYEQRTGFIDYFYNNYQALRKCMNSNCEICHGSLEAVWADLHAGLDPSDICKDFAGTKRPLFMREEEALDQCMRMARGFAMNSKGVMHKLSTMFGNVESLKQLGDCDRELMVMQRNVRFAADEVCLEMDCCKVGRIRSASQLEIMRNSLAKDVAAQEEKSNEKNDELAKKQEEAGPSFSRIG